MIYYFIQFVVDDDDSEEEEEGLPPRRTPLAASVLAASASVSVRASSSAAASSSEMETSSSGIVDSEDEVGISYLDAGVKKDAKRAREPRSCTACGKNGHYYTSCRDKTMPVVLLRRPLVTQVIYNSHPIPPEMESLKSPDGVEMHIWHDGGGGGAVFDRFTRQHVRRSGSGNKKNEDVDDTSEKLLDGNLRRGQRIRTPAHALSNEYECGTDSQSDSDDLH